MNLGPHEGCGTHGSEGNSEWRHRRPAYDGPGSIHIRTKGDRMQISDTMNAAFNDQITMELQAAHNYLAMGAWLESAGFSGMSVWMQAQSAAAFEDCANIAAPQDAG